MTQIGPEAFQSQSFGSGLLVAQAVGSESGQASLGGQALGEEKTDAILGAALIIGVPTVFWMGVMEAYTAMAGMDYGLTERVLIGGAIVGFLAVVRGCAKEASR